MKTILLLLSVSFLILSQTDKPDHSNHNTKCDSLTLNYIHDLDLQKKCDSYYKKKLTQIPKVKIKEKKKAKTFADSIKKEIEYLIKSYKWTDSGVKINFLADDIFPVPSFAGTVWDDSIITAYVKGPEGCQKIKLRRGNGYPGFVISSCDTVNDTIRKESYRLHFKNKLYLTQVISIDINMKGDTISGGGHDVMEDGGVLSHVMKKYIEFSGESVFLKAQCNQIDTIEIKCKKYKNEKCLICRGIDIVSAGSNTLHGYISNRKKITLTKNCKENPCKTTQVPIAIYLINSILKRHKFLIKSSERGPRIYSNCKECQKDTSSVLFPFAR